MEWGLAHRLARVFRPEDGRTVMLAVDHGYFLGPTQGLERPREALAPLLPHADSLMCTRGLLRNCVPPAAPPVVLRVSGGASVLQEDLSDEERTVSLEEAVRCDAAAVALSIFVGAPHERRTLKSLARLVDEAHGAGVPVLAVTAVGKEMARDARYLSLACRIAAEMGAHLVKTYHCDGFEQVTGTCPVPVVIAGGKKVPEKEALALCGKALAAGAAGVDMGRNIFQSSHPAAMIRAVRAVVHERRAPAEAHDLFLSLAR